MKCSICQGPLSINSKGLLSCPTCSGIKKKLTLGKITYNNFTFYKVLKSTNIVADDYLTSEEVDKFIKKGIEVYLK